MLDALLFPRQLHLPVPAGAETAFPLCFHLCRNGFNLRQQNLNMSLLSFIHYKTP